MLAVLIALGVGLVLHFLIQDRTGLLDLLPFAMILLCPLVHLLLHDGHGHGRRGSGGQA
jgi:hypothetical protein